jgi:hypothetical protein
MDRYSTSTDCSDESPPSEAWLFAQAILGRPIPRIVPPEVKARARRAELERLAPLSDRHSQELRDLQAAEGEARRERELLEWAAGISTRAEDQLRALQRKEAEQREAGRRAEQFYESYSASLSEWNEADHPRAPKGTSSGGQWVPKGGGAGSGGPSSGKSSSVLDKIIQRNQTFTKLTGVATPSMIRSTKIAAELQSAAKLPGEVARAAAAGLLTGGKANVNGFATAVKDAATLGLRPGQLELIGVTKEDRERGYDTAVAISTASGQILIAVGTGAAASVLSKGGSIARTAGGALVAYDTTGNAVGVVLGLYDASQNGVNVANGAKVAGGLLGLSANARSARDLSRVANARRLAEVDEFVKKLPRKTTPTSTAAGSYEIKHTGPYNYTVSGGGAKFDIDGYRGTTILEAKHVTKPHSSPYVPGSSCPEAVRSEIVEGVRSEFTKLRKIIESGSTPFKQVEVITNSLEAKSFFEALLKELRVPGKVRVAS